MKIAIVDDEKIFCDSLVFEFKDDGYDAYPYYDLVSFLNSGKTFDVIFLDMKIDVDNSLKYLEEIRQIHLQSKIYILTGFGSIATTVEAIKKGADDYLLKPISYLLLKEKVEKANNELTTEDSETYDVMTLDRAEREYIEYILASCDGNISKAAEKLGIHRQSLQRKLKKFTPN